MKRLHFAFGTIAVCTLLAVSIGCGEKSKKSESTTSKVDGSPYLLNAAPEDAKNVIAVRKAAKDGDDVVVVGRIGGSVDPWVKNRAAFSIVDVSIKSCLDTKDDGCPTPWDYCCETDKLPNGTVLIKIVDKNNELVKSGARELLKLKELQLVNVVGKAKRDEAGNLTVLATGLFVEN